MTWNARTKQDAVPVEQHTINHTCERCGRVTTVDMLVDVSPLPESIRGKGVTWACDACCGRWIRDGTISRMAFCQALGAPAAALADIAAFVQRSGVP